MKTLAIDTSNQTMAVAVVDDQQILGQVQTMEIKNHSATLMPAISNLMASLSLKPTDLKRIVVAQGPGSYTGLRIGVTTAKTLAKTLNTELVGVSSLAAIAANCVGISKLIVPLFDARRQNVYAGGYRWEKNRLQNVLPDRHVSLADLLNEVKGQEVYFVGADSAKFMETIQTSFPQGQRNMLPLWDYPSGITLAAMAAEKTPESSVDDFLPHYLKRVEAEEKWLETHTPGAENYVEKI